MMSEENTDEIEVPLTVAYAEDGKIIVEGDEARE